jgi:hypothetical protein
LEGRNIKRQNTGEAQTEEKFEETKKQTAYTRNGKKPHILIEANDDADIIIHNK